MVVVACCPYPCRPASLPGMCYVQAVRAVYFLFLNSAQRFARWQAVAAVLFLPRCPGQQQLPHGFMGAVHMLHARLSHSAGPVDLLMHEMRAQVLKPSFVLLRDERLRSIVLSIRGTHSFKDMFTSLTGGWMVWSRAWLVVAVSRSIEGGLQLLV